MIMGKEKKDVSGPELLAFVAIGMIAIYGSLLTSGLVLSNLWEWFVVPAGAPAIGFAQATGIVIIARLITWQDCAKEGDAEHPGCYWFLMAYGLPIFYLGIGWALHLLTT